MLVSAGDEMLPHKPLNRIGIKTAVSSAWLLPDHLGSLINGSCRSRPVFPLCRTEGVAGIEAVPMNETAVLGYTGVNRQWWVQRGATTTLKSCSNRVCARTWEGFRLI